MIKMLFVFVFFPTVFFGQANLQPKLTPYDEEARQTFSWIVQTHSEPEISTTLLEWIMSGKVKLSLKSKPYEQITTDLRLVNGKLVPFIIVNPAFMLEKLYTSPPYNNDRAEEACRRLAIYHEYWHIVDYLQVTLAQFNTRLSLEKEATHYWDREVRAVRKEWQLAKKIGFTGLVLHPDTARMVQQLGEVRGLKASMLITLKRQYANTPKAVWIPYWEKIARQ